MSKASEWARRLVETKAAHEQAAMARPQSFTRRLANAYVNDDGTMLMTGEWDRSDWSPADAIDFAEWILSTFSDP